MSLGGFAIGKDGYVARRVIEEIKFASDSPLEGDGFEPSVPREKTNL